MEILKNIYWNTIQKINNFFHKDNEVFYLGTTVYAFVLGSICYFITNNIDAQTHMLIYQYGITLIAAIAILAIIMFSAHLLNITAIFKTFLNKVIFSALDKSNQSSIVLDKKLNIIFANHHAIENFKLYSRQIKNKISDFDYNNIVQHNCNFNHLNPKYKPNKTVNLLSFDLDASYTNKFYYDNIDFSFTARVFKLFNFKLGLIVEFNFTNPRLAPKTSYSKTNDTSGSTSTTNTTDTAIKHDPELLKDLKLKMLNLMLKDKDNSEYRELYHKVDKIIELEGSDN